MRAMMRKHSGQTYTVAASMFGAFLVSGCGAGGNLETCAEKVSDDVGNLAYGVIGTSVDDLGMPVAGARVFVPGTAVEVFTDANGRFSISADDLGGGQTIQLWAEKDGYPDKVQEVTVPGDHLADVVLTMKPFTDSDVLEAEEGGSVSDGTATVVFQPDSLVYLDSGERVTGEVEISIVSYRPDNVDDMKAAPGKLEGVTPTRDQDGNVTGYTVEAIRTYGMADVSMYQDGRRLELAEGKPATVILENIVEGEQYDDLIEQFNDEHADELEGYAAPYVPLWHFNYDSANWDRVEGNNWSFSQGSEGGYLTLQAEVPEFSPCNPDMPAIVCTSSIDIVEPVETCVCKNVMHKNDIEPVRGASMSLMSRARAYTYLVVSCSNGSSTRTLVNSTVVTAFDRATTDQSGNFCGKAILDPLTNSGSVRIDSTKTYWPGRLDDEDIQYQDVDNDGTLDDDGDGQVDPGNKIGFLGDTYTDTWTRPLSGASSCGAPGEVIHVDCINEPTDPTTGKQPQ